MPAWSAISTSLRARKPDRIAAVRRELAQYDDLAAKAVDEYTADRRVIGNSLLAHSRGSTASQSINCSVRS